MDNLIFTKKDFMALVDGMIQKMTVYGPTPKQGNYTFSKISSFKDLIYDYTYTTLPPKKILFPQKETVMTFSRDDIEKTEAVVESEQQCIVGVHPCDIHGIILMDMVFEDDYKDTNYCSKREKTIIIGMDCIPDDECFCTSLNTDAVASGFDLFLTPVGESFVVTVGSNKGEELVRELGDIQNATHEDIEDLLKYRGQKKEQMSKTINAGYQSLPLYYSGAFKLDLWEKHAKNCFDCGSCIMVCPTCYCFNIEDNVELDLNTGTRERMWDACMLPDFAKVATGENFRKTTADRLKHRFNRKFQFHMVKYGKLFCIGCGRCSRSCLAEIKPPDITNEIIKLRFTVDG